MKKQKIIAIIGARPQFIKHCPVELELIKYFDLMVIHTGQHYDEKMSEIFFDEFKLKKPDYRLNIGSGSHGNQTGRMLIQIEEILIDQNPRAVLVYGDTNSTLAGAIAASKLNIPLIHVEAGLRSFNRSMPEEINRILTDHSSSFLFAPTNEAILNLKNENISDNVYNIGDVMYDMIRMAKEKIGTIIPADKILVTLHRPYNVDEINRLNYILETLQFIGTECIFPIHPRTLSNLNDKKINLGTFTNINFIDPLSYFDMIRNILSCSCIITDSGGIQKEAYLLKRKCITIRSETEWIETLIGGWNSLLFDDLSSLKNLILTIPGEYNDHVYGDSFAATKLSAILVKSLMNKE